MFKAFGDHLSNYTLCGSTHLQREGLNHLSQFPSWSLEKCKHTVAMIGVAVPLLSIHLPIQSFHPCKQTSITACGRTHSLSPFSRAFSYDHKNRKCHWLSFDSLTQGVRTEKDFNFDLYEKKGRSSFSSSASPSPPQSAIPPHLTRQLRFSGCSSKPLRIPRSPGDSHICVYIPGCIISSG